jgi:O-antigen/teichoic acid export membrane protein
MTHQTESTAAITTRSVPFRFAAFGTLLSIMARGANIVVVASLLTVDDQALFFTLSGLLGFQLAFELGFVYLLQNSASHEFARLEWRDGQFVGDPTHIERLSSLFRFGMFWLTGAGIAMVLILLPCATYAYSAKLPAASDYWLPLLAFSIAIQAVDLPLQGCVAFLTGLRDPRLQVRNSALVAILASTGSMLAAYSGAGAFCLPIGMALGQIGTGTHLAFTRRDTLTTLFMRASGVFKRFFWARELLPVQWRLGLAWISGAFYYQYLPSSILPAYGTETAAKYGISNTICQASFSIANAFVVAATPTMATLAANRDYKELDIFAMRILTGSTMVLAICLSIFVILATPEMLPHWLTTTVSNQLLPSEQAFCVAIVSFSVHFSGVLGTYVRAHRYEPLMPLGVIGACVNTAWISFASKRLPFLNLIIGTASINLFLNVLIIAIFTFYLRRQRDRQTAHCKLNLK